MKRRIFAIVLSCLMVLSLLPVAVFAEEAECEHEYVETVLLAPTCEAEGVAKITCKKCDLPATYAKIGPHLLDEGTVIKAATCGEGGSIKYACTACDYTKVEDIEATGEHTYDDGVIGATCTEPAKAGSVCTVCGEQEPETVFENVQGSEALGHDWVLDTKAEDYVAAECEKGGVDTFKCSRCDATKKEETEALDHKWDAGVVKNATCDYGKHVLNTCTVCGETKVTGIDGENPEEGGIGHVYKEVEVVAPTCTEVGYTLKKCDQCGGTRKVNEVPATEHETYTEVVPATCDKEGYTLTLCKKCDFSEKVVGSETPIDPDGHKIVAGAILKEATCDSKGVAKKLCSVCEKELGYMSVEADCAWDKGVVVTPNTCEEDGEILYTCTACGETKTEVIPADHDRKYEIIEAGNCGKDGKMVVTCSRCDFKEEEVIKATGEHKFVEKVLAATCTSPAMVGVACEICDTPEGEMEPVEGMDKLGHDYKETYVAATCTSPAYVQVTCSRCDSAYQEQLTNADGSYINPALGHDLKKGDTVKPDCDDYGYTLYSCSRCDYTEEQDIKAADGHEYEEKVVKPTCVAKGYTNMVCKTCKDTYVKENSETEINPEGHEEVQIGVLQAATCTTPGVGKMACKYCEVAMGYKAIAPAHKWDKGTVTTPKTCTEDGVKTFACTVCGVNPTEEEMKADKLDPVVKAGHDIPTKGVVTTAATCGKDGVETFKCKNCDYAETKAIEATGEHTYAEKIIAATCEDIAYVASVCKVCEDVESKLAIEGSEALGHNLVDTLLPADCENAQRVESACTRCDYTETEETKIPGTEALGHAWDEGVVFEPECEVAGYTLFTCARCGETEERDETPALEHNYVETVTLKATCAATGKKEMVCTLCETVDPEAEAVEIAIDPTNHTPVEDKILQDPTCTAYGVAKMKCKDCGAGLGYQAIDPEHKLDDGKITTPATCETAGVKTYSCTVCTYTETEEIAAGHKYNDGVVTTPATCGKDGVMTYTCSACVATTEGHSYTEVIPASGEHTFAETIIPADCENPAMAGIACTVCGTPETELTIVTGSEALGHNYEDVLLPADCTNPMRVQTTCSRCNDQIVTDLSETLENAGALGHNLKNPKSNGKGQHRGICLVCKKMITEDCVNGEATIVEATCQSGTISYADCKICGATNSKVLDGNKNPENHEYDIETVLVAATCSTPGISKFTCSCDEDGKIYKYATTTKAHTWGEDLVNENATAVYHVCSVCGEEEIIEKFEGYVCKEHKNIVEDAAKTANCYENGLTAGKHCEDCGTVIVAQIVLPKIHNYEVVGFKYNEDYDYVEIHKCADCGHEIEVLH